MSITILICMLVITYVQCELFPRNYQVTYQYKSTIRTEVISPAVFTSDYVIYANVTVIGSGNVSFVSLNDLLYTQYCGEDELVGFYSRTQKIPAKQAESIKRPFIIEYNEGQAVGIRTENDDKLWSINIKKAIASLLQLDLVKLNVNKTNSNGFHSTENSVYGPSPTLYTVIPKENSQYFVKKQIKLDNSDFKWNTNVVFGPNAETLNDKMSMSIERNYEIEKFQQRPLMNRINSINVIILSEPTGTDNPHITLINQTLVKIDIKKVDKSPVITSKMTHHDLKVINIEIDNEKAPTKEKIYEKTKEEIEKITKNFKSKEYNLNITLELEDETLYTVLEMLKLFDSELFESLLSSYKSEIIETDKLYVYLELLPYVGTKHSTLFIRDIILNENVTSERAQRMLRNLPPHIKDLDISTVQELISLIENVSAKAVKHAAILSISSTLSKAIERYPYDPHVEDVVRYFIDKFKLSPDRESELVYMGALRNIKSKTVTDFLGKIVLKEYVDRPIKPHTRSLAILAVKDEHVKDEKLVNEVYWPILLDKSECLEVRFMAMKTLLANASVENLIQLYGASLDDLGEELYYALLTHRKGVINSKSPSYDRIKLNNEKVANKDDPSNYENDIFLIGDYVLDYFERAFGFGSMLKVSVIGNSLKDKFISIYAQLSHQFARASLDTDSIYLYMHVGDDEVLSKATLLLKYNKWQYSQELISMLLFSDITLDIVLLKNNMVTAAYHVPPGDIASFFNDVAERYFDFRNNNLTFYGIEYNIKADIKFPTDMGVPLCFFVQMPSMHMTRTRTVAKDYISQLMVHRVQSNHLLYGAKIYNPFLNVWQGNKRIQATFVNAPIEYSRNSKTDLIKIYNRANDGLKSIGVRCISRTYVFIEDAQYLDNKGVKKLLGRTCNDCERKYIVAKKETKQKTLLDVTLKHIGIAIKSQISGSDHCVSRTRLEQLSRSMFGNGNKNADDYPIVKIPMAIEELFKYSLLYSTNGPCDFEFYFNALHEKVEVNYNLNVHKKPLELIDKIFANVNITYRVNRDDNMEKLWALNASVEYKGLVEGKIDATAIDYLEDKKLCLEAKKVWKGYTIKNSLLFEAGKIEENCPQNETLLEIISKGRMIPITRDIPVGAFESCIGPNNVNYKCVDQRTSLRHYEIDVRFKNIEFEHKLVTLELFKDVFSKYGGRIEPKVTTRDGQAKIILDYPPKTQTIDLNIKIPGEEYDFSEIPAKDWPLEPEGAHMVMFEMEAYTCSIKPGYLKTYEGAFGSRSRPLDEWIRSDGDCLNGPCEWEVSTMQTNPFSVWLRVSSAGETLEVHNEWDMGFKLYLNGRELEGNTNGNYEEKWFIYTIYDDVYIYLKDVGINIIYVSDQVGLRRRSGNDYNSDNGECNLGKLD